MTDSHNSPMDIIRARIAATKAGATKDYDLGSLNTYEAEPLTAAEMAEQMASLPSFTRPGEPEPIATKETPFQLRQYALISTGAFTIYLKGLPLLPSLKAIESLSLDKVFAKRIPSIRLHGPGRATLTEEEMATRIEAKNYAHQNLAYWYQSDNKAKHIEMLTHLLGMGISLTKAKTADRGLATVALEAWKADCLTYCAEERIINPAEGTAVKAPKLTAATIQDALDSL